MDLIALAEQVFPQAAAIAGNVKPDQYTNPTPCEHWDVHTLLNHMISTHHMFAALVRDEIPMEPLDEIGDDPGPVYTEAITSSLAAFKLPGAMEKVLPLPMGPTPGAMALGMLIMDNVVHGWDLSKGTGQPTGIDEGIAAGYLEQLSQMAFPRHPEPGAPFGPEVAVPAGASNAERLLGFLGRRP